MARKYEVRSHRANHHNQQLAKEDQKITDTGNNQTCFSHLLLKYIPPVQHNYPDKVPHEQVVSDVS